MSKNKLLAQLEIKVEAKGGVVTDFEPESVSGQTPFTYMADPQFQMRGGFKNPMVDAAMPLFGMVMRVRKLDALPNIVEVRKLVHIQITAIVHEMQQHPYDPVQLQAYSYGLCLYIDEAVMSRPWGKNSVWSERPLLSDFHQETQGGEKVFSVLQGMMQEPKRFKDVLEFMYYCVCLGLKGKYAIEPKGEESLQSLILDLYAIIRELRGPVPKQLSDPLANVVRRPYRHSHEWFPWWSPLLISGLAMIALYSYYRYRLHLITSEVVESLNKIIQ